MTLLFCNYSLRFYLKALNLFSMFKDGVSSRAPADKTSLLNLSVSEIFKAFLFFDWLVNETSYYFISLNSFSLSLIS